MNINYLEAALAIDKNAQVSTFGSVFVYEDLNWQSPIISKETLDATGFTLAQNEMWDNIKGERDYRSQNGGYKVGTDWFHSDQASRTQQIALVMLGASMPAGIMWKTMSGTFVSMTPTLASQIFQTAVMSDQNLFGIAEQKRSALMNEPNPKDYNYKTGWPQIYQETIV